MKTNILILLGFTLFLLFVGGINHFIGFEFFMVLVMIVAAALLLRGVSVSQLRWMAWVVTGLFIVFMVIGPTMGIISLYRSGDDRDARTSDNAVQIDAAATFLLHGKNPYAENYLSTPLATLYKGEIAPGLQNPALYHLISLPGDLLLTTAAHAIVAPIVGWFDVRMLYAVLFVACGFMAYQLGTDPVSKLRSLILVCCNPLLVTFTVEGRSDIVCLTFMLATLLLLHHRRRSMAAAAFAFACATKAFAWVLVPIIGVLVFTRTPGATLREKIRANLLPLLIGVAVLGLLYAPFLIWNAHAFIDSVIRYPNGSAAISYPVLGEGFSFLLLRLGIIRHLTDYYPLWIFQALALVPLLVLLLPRVWRSSRISIGLFVGALLLFANQYFARYFYFNHLGFMLSLAAIGYGFMSIEQKDLVHGQVDGS